MTPAQIAKTITLHWAIEVSAVEPLSGGMNSATMLVSLPFGRFVAKWVPAHERDSLIRGAFAAKMMAAANIRSGAPLPTAEGALTVSALGGEMVLLEEVLGRELGYEAVDQPAWGYALGRVHAAARCEPGEAWLETLLGSEPIREPWVRRVLELVLAELAALPSLTWSQLHTDPAPEAFIIDAGGDVGVIDWTGSVAGPVLYDIASAVMYAGGEENAGVLLAAYLAASPVSQEEVSGHLKTFRRLRAAVQAAYFARRIANDDLTGIHHRSENEKGMADARRMLSTLGIDLAD